MTKRIFRSICFAAFAVFIGSLVLIMGVLYGYFSRIQQNQLRVQTELAARGVAGEGLDYFKNLETGDFRITWIDETGKVLYDSQSDTSWMENHLEREEIREAFSEGYGESRRYSQTLMERLLYCARLLEDGTVIRLSTARYTIWTLVISMAQPLCLIALAALFLSVLLAVRLSEKIVSPLNKLNLDDPLGNQEYDEISPLLKRINHQQIQLKRQEEELERKEKELDAIVGNMKEGMILLNCKGIIITINPAARRLLDTDRGCIGEDILTVSRNLGMQEVFARALEGEEARQIVLLGKGRYEVSASPVIVENQKAGRSAGAGGISEDVKSRVSGVAVLFLDVTEKEKAEEIRREFTANVSHELKTPLHVISGYAELLQSGMAKEEDMAIFAEKIRMEAGRMSRLVEDIISLSHLDGGVRVGKFEKVDLYKLAETVILGLEPEGIKGDISLKLSGERVVINGIPQLLHSILYNLCDNGIKYNRKGGSVSVEIKRDKDRAVVSVEDTGIGIAPEHQERIFERFYRVDKSRSREVGGTGLGLSIVKHGAKVHHAGIEVHSTVGEGTRITVSFPVQRIDGRSMAAFAGLPVNSSSP